MGPWQRTGAGRSGSERRSTVPRKVGSTFPCPSIHRTSGGRARYYVAGTINGKKIRGRLDESGKGHFLPLGPAYRRDTGLRPGDAVDVVLADESPPREGLAADVTAALDAEPEAGRFFDALAGFYRKNYLRWIDATKRRPDVRAARIAELVELCKAGRNQRPR